MVCFPILDGLLNGFARQILFSCFGCQCRKFIITRKTQCHNLSGPQPAIKRLSGQDEMTQAFFRTDGPVLGFQPITPHDPSQQQEDEKYEHQQ